MWIWINLGGAAKKWCRLMFWVSVCVSVCVISYHRPPPCTVCSDAPFFACVIRPVFFIFNSPCLSSPSTLPLFPSSPSPFRPTPRPTMGYFASGAPKTYVHPTTPSSVRQILLDPSHRFVLNVTSHALFIWSAAHHRILLSTYQLPSSTIAEDGPLISAAWSPDSSVIIAALQSGLVLLLKLRQRTDRQLLAMQPSDTLVQPPRVCPLLMSRVSQLRVAHAATRVTALVSCPAGALVATTASTLTCIAWDGDMLWRTHIPELLRHNNAIVKMGVFQPISTAEQKLLNTLKSDANDDNLGGIQALAYDHQLAYCAVVLGDGAAFLLALHSAGYAPPSANRRSLVAN